jgi:hypothetical protein
MIDNRLSVDVVLCFIKFDRSENPLSTSPPAAAAATAEQAKRST